MVRGENKNSSSLTLQIFKKSSLPLLITILITALFFIYLSKFKDYVNEIFHKYILKATLAIFTLIITLWLQRIGTAAFNWYAENIAAKTPSRLDDKFTPLLKRTTNIVIWIIAILVILSNLGINIGALIAALGVGSLAIALAAQDTIANIISGFLIMVDRPFRIGDEIKLPSGERVKVLEIGIRRSRFLNLDDNAIVIVPNLDMSKSKIINFSYGKERKEV